jgi:tRNA(Arg) A34 adenosine deaminase TadA
MGCNCGQPERWWRALMLYAQIHLTLPTWIHEAIDPQSVCVDDEAKVALAIELSRLNIAHTSGGPFGAAVFDGDSGRLLGIGVNRAVPLNCSVAHAEMMAFMTAQARTGLARLNENGARIVLATSAQPCCMCYGASFWAGIDTLLIGARSEDVMALTDFDEGPLPADWIGELEKRSIVVRRDIQRDAACAVLREFGKGDGNRY